MRRLFHLSNHNNRGFTLAELLVVVAIIAILVAVSIVIFTGKQKEAKATVCEANRTSLKHHLAVDYMAGELEKLTEGAFEEYIKIDEAVCPSGGVYSYYGSFESGFKIKCSYHDGDGSSGGTEAKSAVDNLIDAVKEIIDITGQNRNSEIVKAFFGLDFGPKEKTQNLGDEYLKFAKDVSMADIFNGVDLNKLANQIKEMNGGRRLQQVNKVARNVQE